VHRPFEHRARPGERVHGFMRPITLLTMDHSSRFSRVARSIAVRTGHPATFALAILVVVAWAATGPFVDFSDTWQLVINTGTTVATFLMVFLIQNTQNRDSIAMQLKLDELIRAVEGAHNALLDLEELDQEELESMRANYESLAERARASMRAGGLDTGSPPVQTAGPKN
jgi:low affinity Fe/Cu permease